MENKRKTKANPVLARYAQRERRKSSVKSETGGHLLTVGGNTRKERIKRNLRAALSAVRSQENRQKVRSGAKGVAKTIRQERKEIKSALKELTDL